MPTNPTSFADHLRDWEQLLGAANDNQELLAVAQPQRDALAATLADLRQAKLDQESSMANRQEATQRLRELLDRGRDQARSLRGMARGLLGPANEALVRFRVPPLRRRGRRSRPEVPPADDTVVAAAGES